MYNSTIKIESIDIAREFVSKMGKYPQIEVTLKSGNYSIDGHSIIGVISLDMSHPIELCCKGDIGDDFINDVKPYAI